MIIEVRAKNCYAFEDDIKKCFDCGMNAHIAKPIDIRRLMEELRKYLR